MIPSAPRKSFTADEFVRDMQLAGFLGAYKFWSKVVAGNDLREHGNELLRALAVLAWATRNPRPLTTEEEEAFRYCGLEIP